MVVQYNKVMTETETVFSLGDILNIIEYNLGSDIVNALLDFMAEEKEEEKYNVIEYIEDGIFEKQVEESGLIKRLVDEIIVDLKESDFLKKNKDITKFSYDESYYNEIIEDLLEDGIRAYFSGVK